MEFKKVFISELKPAQYNPRKDLKPEDPEYQRIKKSIEEFGYVDPIIINSDYTVIGGHQRLKVLKESGLSSIDVVLVNLPKTKEKALNVALNKIAGEWDFEKLDQILNDLKVEEFDITITGFPADFQQGINDIEKEWQGMPEFNSEDLTAYKSLIVHFRSEEDYNRFGELIRQKLPPQESKKKTIWFPPDEILHSDLVIENV